AAVLAKISVRPGERLQAEKVRRDIATVYASGFFQDVQVLVEPEADGSLRVVFLVDEKPTISAVRLEGNKKIDEDDLRELIQLRTLSVLSEAKIQETAQRIRDKYVEKGFYLAQVDPVIQPSGPDRVDVVFRIVENRKVIVQRIEFVGNEKVPDSKIKRFLQTKEGGFAPWLTNTGSFDRSKLELDQQRVQYVFLEEGYLDARVEPAKVYLSPDKRFIYISFHVDEGEQYNLGKVDAAGDFIEEQGLTHDAVTQIIDGRSVADVQEEQWREAHGRRVRERTNYPRRASRLEPGEPYKYSTVGEVLQSISRFYQDQGYAFVNVQPDTRPDPATHEADVTFLIDTGDKMRIGRINITGNDPTLDKVVRREIVFNEGDTYRGTLVDASRFRLQRLGFFEDVAISTPRGDAPDVLDVNVKVTEQPTGSFSLGIGYSNLERLAVNGSIQKNNFLGMGYTISASVNWSRLRQQASLSFFDPYFLDSRWTLQLDGFWIQRQFQLNEYQRGATVGVGRYLDRRDDIQLRLSYTIEDVGIVQLDAYRQRLLGGALFRNGLTSRLGMSLIVDRRNNRIFPTQGFYATADVSMAGGFRAGGDKVVSLLGGDFNFVEAKLNFRFYQPLIPHSDMLVFRLNTTLGSIWSTDGRVVPFIHRYRAGGINSVRGFQWFSLGPTLRTIRSDDPSDGDDKIVVGGTQTWINNIEIESPIIKAAGISAVVFFDAGNTFGDAWGEGTINPLELRTAAGFGIRWRSPIGPLRFELGFPLAPRDGERKSVFDFSIGSFF
ncbi:MAG TPA: outer membrane protein assembly factor BamA, partial [Myxococcota bacterium]|nr:outer membrane protein assembly factor BamA [Myxococcota bacterium]